jgi:ribokinase
MIIVVGRLLALPVADGGIAGMAGGIAVAAAARGAPVELVGKLGDDPAGDRVLFALSRARVGHSAVLRDPSRPTPVGRPPRPAGPDEANDEWLDDGDPPRDAHAHAAPGSGGAAAAGSGGAAASGSWSDLAGLALAPADLELALRYLTDLTVLVLADPESPALVPVAADAAGFAGAALVILDGTALRGESAPDDATVLSAPDDDPDGAFAALVAEYAVALDAGRPPAAAWAAATGRLGAERA